MIQIDAGGPLPLACHASFHDAKGPAWTHVTSLQLLKLCHVAKRDSTGDSTPLIQWETMPLVLHSPPSDGGHAFIQRPLSLGLCRLCFELGRMAIVASRLCHPFFVFTSPRGRWPSPILSLMLPTSCIEMQHGGGRLLQKQLT